MNKEQLIAATARLTKKEKSDVKNYAKQEIALLTSHIFDAILAALDEEEEMQIKGFGRF